MTALRFILIMVVTSLSVGAADLQVKTKVEGDSFGQDFVILRSLADGKWIEEASVTRKGDSELTRYEGLEPGDYLVTLMSNGVPIGFMVSNGDKVITLREGQVMDIDLAKHALVKDWQKLSFPNHLKAVLKKHEKHFGVELKKQFSKDGPWLTQASGFPRGIRYLTAGCRYQLSVRVIELDENQQPKVKTVFLEEFEVD